MLVSNKKLLTISQNLESLVDSMEDCVSQLQDGKPISRDSVADMVKGYTAAVEHEIESIRKLMR